MYLVHLTWCWFALPTPAPASQRLRTDTFEQHAVAEMPLCCDSVSVSCPDDVTQTKSALCHSVVHCHLIFQDGVLLVTPVQNSAYLENDNYRIWYHLTWQNIILSL